MNYYEILKVSQKASPEEIKSSYKTLVKKYHPDLYKGDKDFAETKIKEINEAYDILSNPESKKEYDEYLNPPQPLQTYTQNYTNTYTKTYSQYNKKQQYNSNPQPQPEPILTNFILKKFNKLDSKTQLKIFILFFVFILSLFLINLIQIKSHLKKFYAPNVKETITETNEQQQHLDEPKNNTSSEDSVFNIDTPSNSDDKYTTEDFEIDEEELEKILTEFFKQFNELNTNSNYEQ